MTAVTLLATISGVVLVMLIPSLPVAGATADGGCDSHWIDSRAVSATRMANRSRRRRSIEWRQVTTTSNRRQRPRTSSATDLGSSCGGAFCADANAECERQRRRPRRVEALCGFAPVGRAGWCRGGPRSSRRFGRLGFIGGRCGRIRSGCRSSIWRRTSGVGTAKRPARLWGKGSGRSPCWGRRCGSGRGSWAMSGGSGTGAVERVTAGRVAHTYGRAGAMPVSVTLTWTADYAVGGGGFRAIGGTTTTSSPVRVLPVQETETVTSG